MQPICALLLLVLCIGSALGAPSDPEPGDKSLPAAPASADPDVAIQTAEKSLKKVREQLQDAVAAIIATAAEPAGQIKAADPVTVTRPEINIKPVAVTANKKYAEIIGQFIADLIQIPIVLLHAFGEAIAGLTGSKQPLLVYPGASGSFAGVQTPPPYKVE